MSGKKIILLFVYLEMIGLSCSSITRKMTVTRQLAAHIEKIMDVNKKILDYL